MSMKKSKDTMGNRTRDLLACSAVPQPTALPRAPFSIILLYRNLQDGRSTEGRLRGEERVLVGKPEEKRQFGRPRRRWEDNKSVGRS
jgi:hypothetical protein